jgi:hypothetical protein|tara:strand:- start:199 stop:705 length:507 start_codon:yes stop_codon:yes gene_type:complete
MKKIIFFAIATLLVLSFSRVFANTLNSEAETRGINSTCLSHLTQMEDYYDSDGLNITFAHPTDPSNYPSLHTSNKKYNNGSSFFATTLLPVNEFCYVSINKTTVINNLSCSDIAQTRLDKDPTITMETYSEGSYIHISPESNEYQLILISTGDSSCAMIESQMLWPEN